MASLTQANASVDALNTVLASLDDAKAEDVISIDIQGTIDDALAHARRHVLRDAPQPLAV